MPDPRIGGRPGGGIQQMPQIVADARTGGSLAQHLLAQARVLVAEIGGLVDQRRHQQRHAHAQHADHAADDHQQAEAAFQPLVFQPTHEGVERHGQKQRQKHQQQQRPQHIHGIGGQQRDKHLGNGDQGKLQFDPLRRKLVGGNRRAGGGRGHCRRWKGFAFRHLQVAHQQDTARRTLRQLWGVSLPSRKTTLRSNTAGIFMRQAAAPLTTTGSGRMSAMMNWGVYPIANHCQDARWYPDEQ